MADFVPLPCRTPARCGGMVTATGRDAGVTLAYPGVTLAAHEPASAGHPAAGHPALSAACFPALSDAAIGRIAAEIAAGGVCRLDDAIAPALLAEARDHAEAAVAANDGEYIARIGAQADAGYLLSGIRADPAFTHLLDRLHRAAGGAAGGRAAATDHVHQVLRCLKGATARRHAGYLHYDSYVVTILIPLAVPDAGDEGDLMLIRRRRPLRRSYLANAIEKLVLDRAPVQRRMWRRIRAGRTPAWRIRLRPGSVYIFWGYHSLHANEPSDPAGLRATLLYHYGNPHAASPLLRWRRGE